ncbi:MAG: YbaN family protein [Anaerocolumna sp.]
MNIKNILFVVAGLISVTLGTIGIFLPILPTTPFLLLAAGCFSAGSPKLESILIKNRYLGSYIENYRYKTGVPRKTKIQAILFLWCGLLVSMLIINTILVNCILIIIGILVTIHLSIIKTKV